MIIHAWLALTTTKDKRQFPKTKSGTRRDTLDDEVGPGVRRFSLPDRRLCARTPFYCKTRSTVPSSSWTWAIVTEDSWKRDPGRPRAGARDIEQAALEELIRFEEDVGDELLCSATVERINSRRSRPSSNSTNEDAARRSLLE